MTKRTPSHSFTFWNIAKKKQQQSHLFYILSSTFLDTHIFTPQIFTE